MSTQISNNTKKTNQSCFTQQCTICSQIFYTKVQDQARVIQIDNEYYCEKCLQQKLLEEEDNIKKLQERYIYYKQYQSSINAKEYCQMQLKQKQENIHDMNQIQKLQHQNLTLQQLLLKTKQQCKILKEKVITVENQQDKFWQNINRFEKRAIKLQDKSLAAKLQKGHVKSEFDQLTNKSLYHQVFNITIKDNIGYISGLAMGKKSQAQQINWQQFNAGLGHLFIGINILFLKYDFCYVKFQQVNLKSSQTQVLLYGRDKKCQIAYSKQNQKPFGQVMQALLIQIFHFSYHLMQVLNLEYNQQVKLPYTIKQKQFKIADVPINPNKITQKHKWNKWSQGIKYLLVNFKHLLTIHAIYGKD